MIAKYVPIDPEAVEIQIETRNRETQLTVSSVDPGRAPSRRGPGQNASRCTGVMRSTIARHAK